MYLFNSRPLLREEAKQEGGEGGGEQKPPAFDPVVFQTALLAEIDKRVNGLDKKYKQTFDGFKTSIESLKPKEQQQEEQHVEGQTEKGKPDPEKQALLKRVDALTKSFEEQKKANEQEKARSEQIERLASIKTKLGGLGLAGDAEIETAFRLFKDEVKRDEEGNLVAGPDAEPFDKYMERQVKTIYTFLLPSKGVGGAGASKGNGNQSTTFDIDKIRPGMSADERASAYRELKRAAG